MARGLVPRQDAGETQKTCPSDRFNSPSQDHVGEELQRLVVIAVEFGGLSWWWKGGEQRKSGGGRDTNDEGQCGLKGKNNPLGA